MSELFEFVFEFITDVLGEMYIGLMQMIIPRHSLSEKRRNILKKLVSVFSCVLLLLIFSGLMLFLFANENADAIGLFLTVIPSCIIVVQIVVGLVVRFVLKK